VKVVPTLLLIIVTEAGFYSTPGYTVAARR